MHFSIIVIYMYTLQVNVYLLCSFFSDGAYDQKSRKSTALEFRAVNAHFGGDRSYCHCGITRTNLKFLEPGYRLIHILPHSLIHVLPHANKTLLSTQINCA